jgi:hypothetical protein
MASEKYPPMPEEPGGARPSRQSGSWQESLRDAGPYLGLGMQLAFTMVFFTIGGYFLDGWLETLPWLTIAGAVLGMTAVFIHLVRVSKSLPSSRRTRRSVKADDPGTWAGGAPASSSAPVSVDPGAAIETGVNDAKGLTGEKFTALEREFARMGEVGSGKLLLPAWDALDLIERARTEHIPVLGVDTFLLTDAGARPVDTLNLSGGGAVREGWDEAARFVEDLRDSGLHFEVVLGEAQ